MMMTPEYSQKAARPIALLAYLDIDIDVVWRFKTAVRHARSLEALSDYRRHFVAHLSEFEHRYRAHPASVDLDLDRLLSSAGKTGPVGLGGRSVRVGP